MHAYAVRALKDSADFNGDEVRVHLSASSIRAAKLVVLPPPAPELLPKEALCCSMATD